MIKWVYEPAVRRRRLRRERLEKVVSKVTATTTVRPFLAAIIEFARTDFHRRVVWVAERIARDERVVLAWYPARLWGLHWVACGGVVHCDPLGSLRPGGVVGRTEVVVCHWGSVGLAVEVEGVNVPRHEGRWDDRD